jgi:hypothetical protein
MGRVNLDTKALSVDSCAARTLAPHADLMRSRIFRMATFGQELFWFSRTERRTRDNGMEE